MRKINKNILAILIVLQSIIFFSTNTFAQTAIVVHKNVGVFIDSLENFKYLLFTDYSFDDFKGAQVFKYFDDTYKLRVYLTNDRIINKDINEEYIKHISDKISYSENNYVKKDTSIQYSVFLNDGSIIIGMIRSFTNDKIELLSENIGSVNIVTKNVVQVYNSESIEIKSTIPGENPHSSRYFYAPSAIPMEKGEGYFQDIYLLFVSANYAVSNHTTIGGGFSIMPGMAIEEQAFFVNVKAAWQITEKFYLGGGGLVFGIENSSIGLGYAIGTYGSKDHNATLGIGYGYFDDEMMQTPVFTLCGMTRVSKRISLMTENWLGKVTYDDENCYEISPENYFCETNEVTEFHWLCCYGLRFFSDKISVDLGFINVLTSEELFFPGIPYIDFVIRF